MSKSNIHLQRGSIFHCYVSLPERISHLQLGGPLTVRNEEFSKEKTHKVDREFANHCNPTTNVGGWKNHECFIKELHLQMGDFPANASLGWQHSQIPNKGDITVTFQKMPRFFFRNSQRKTFKKTIKLVPPLTNTKLDPNKSRLRGRSIVRKPGESRGCEPSSQIF